LVKGAVLCLDLSFPPRALIQVINFKLRLSTSLCWDC